MDGKGTTIIKNKEGVVKAYKGDFLEGEPYGQGVEVVINVENEYVRVVKKAGLFVRTAVHYLQQDKKISKKRDATIDSLFIGYNKEKTVAGEVTSPEEGNFKDGESKEFGALSTELSSEKMLDGFEEKNRIGKAINF
jgi:hypothetical protein